MRRYIHIILILLGSLIVAGSTPAVGQSNASHKLVSADSLGFGDVFLWNSEVMYLNIRDHVYKNSNVDVQVYSHPLAKGVHALAVRQHTSVVHVNVIRDGECFIARPGLFISNTRLGWKLVWFTDKDCISYADTIVGIKAFIEYRNSLTNAVPLEQRIN